MATRPADGVAVVMAYRDMGDEDRRRAYNHVHGWYLRHGYLVVVEGGTSDKTFTRARAINAGIRSIDARVIVQADPDNLVDPDVLAEAVRLAGEADGIVFPHDRYLRLTPAATASVLSGSRDVATMGPDDCDPDEGYGPNASGGVVVFSRDTWAKARGFDERFGIAGGCDSAFAYACDALVGPARRLVGSVTHLWHPRLPMTDPTTFEWVEQMAILAEYRDAAAQSPAAVGRLVRSR